MAKTSGPEKGSGGPHRLQRFAMRIVADSPAAWWMFFGLGLLLISANWFVPWLVQNEMVYLIHPKRVLEPKFLAADWNFASITIPNTPLFTPLFAVLWSLCSDYMTVALWGRMLLWIPLLAALRYLSKSLAIPPGRTLLALVLYIGLGQSLASGEWIFGGCEQKVLAYLFLLLALAALLREHAVIAGGCAGLATLSHILVGGYGMAGLAVALVVLLARRLCTLRDVVAFAVPASVLAIPALVFATHYLVNDTSASAATGAADTDRLAVLVRGPHHLDPFTFLTAPTVACTVLCFLGLAWAVWRIPEPRQRVVLAAFLGTLVLSFLCGLLFRAFEWFGLLKFYPFRVADTLGPLLFWLLVPGCLFRSVAAIRAAVLRRAIWLVLALSVAVVVGHIATTATTTVRHWYRAGSNLVGYNEGHDKRVVAWIRTHSEPTDVFVADPFWKSFWISTERPTVLNWKSAPYTGQLSVFMQRLQLLNDGKEFNAVGSAIRQQLSVNFRTLSPESLRRLRNEFDGRFYVVDCVRPNLTEHLVYSDRRRWVYDLRSL